MHDLELSAGDVHPGQMELAKWVTDVVTDLVMTEGNLGWFAIVAAEFPQQQEWRCHSAATINDRDSLICKAAAEHLSSTVGLHLYSQ